MSRLQKKVDRSALARKRRQRQRLKAAKVVEFQFDLPVELTSRLARLSCLLNKSRKAVVLTLLRRNLPPTLARVESDLGQLSPLFSRLDQYRRRHIVFSNQNEPPVRVHDEMYTAAEFFAIQRQAEPLLASLARYGVTPDDLDSCLRAYEARLAVEGARRR